MGYNLPYSPHNHDYLVSLSSSDLIQEILPVAPLEFMDSLTELSEQIPDGVRILMSYISECWDIFIVHISEYFIFQNISYFSKYFIFSKYFLFLISYDYDYLLSPISILYLTLSHIYILDNILSCPP